MVLPPFRQGCCLSESANPQEKRKDNFFRFLHTEPLLQVRFPVMGLLFQAMSKNHQEPFLSVLSRTFRRWL